MSNSSCNIEINLQDLPNKIFTLISNNINWFELVKLYQQQGNQNNYLIENPLKSALCSDSDSDSDRCSEAFLKRIKDLGHIKVQHILEFMGAYRKVLIDAVASETIKTIKANEYDILQLNGISIGNCIVSSALGSTNITSDYDITFSGPGAWKIVNCLVSTFKKYVCDSEKQEIIRTIGMSAASGITPEDVTPNCNIHTMSGTFDSNFYLMPDIIVNDKIIKRLNGINVTKFFDMKHNFPNEVSGLELKRLIPIPDQRDIFNNELENLKLKINDPYLDIKNASEINDRYKQLVELSKQIDDFLYKTPREPAAEAAHANIRTKTDFFNKIMEIKRKELEAYYCVSTVLVVVFGMQGGEFEKTGDDTLINKLSFGNFFTSAIENMIDLIKHHRHNFVEGGDASVIVTNNVGDASVIVTNKNVAKKFSKYFQRIYVSLDNYHKKKYPKDEFPFKTELELSNYIVSIRGIKLDNILSHNEHESKFSSYYDIFGLNQKLSYNSKWVKDIEKYLANKVDDMDFKNFQSIVAVGETVTTKSVTSPALDKVRNIKSGSVAAGGGKRKRFKKKRSRKKNKRKKNKKKQTKKR
jgi:hypothetical protein